jgi:inorganic pyrophosphatase
LGFKIPDEIKLVIEAIEKISVDTIGQFKDCTNSIKKEYEKNSTFNDILSNRNSDYVIKLNYGFLKNCVDAIHFINKYIMFLNSTD